MDPQEPQSRVVPIILIVLTFAAASLVGITLYLILTS